MIMVLMFRNRLRRAELTRQTGVGSPEPGGRRLPESSPISSPKWAPICLAICAGAVAATALVGCGDGSDSARPRIVAAMYPLEFIATEIAGAHADVVSLAGGAVEPHDQELTAKQRATVATATTVLYVKGLSPSVDSAVGEATNGMDALDVIGDRARAADPHMWLNPQLLVAVGEALAHRLEAADAAHSRQYRANAAALASTLTQLDADLRLATARCRERLLVTTHGAFAYFAGRYQFRQVNVLGTNPEAQPSPAMVARVISLMRESDVSSVYTEIGGSDDVAKTIAAETGARIRTLYPIETPVTGQTYLSMMRHNRDQVVAGQGCVRQVGGGSSIVTPDAAGTPGAAQ